MKNKSKVIALAIALVVVMSAFVVIATENPISGGQAKTGNDDNNDVTPDGPALTTIEATMTAVGYWENITSYGWTVDKVYVEDGLAQANDQISSLKIEPGESATLHFDITANRSAPVVNETDGARGVVSVCNTGGNATENLTISVTVQGLDDGTWVDLATGQVSTAAKPVLGAGESNGYTYDVAFDGSGYTEFRAVANVTITNFVDHSDVAYGTDANASFELPSEITNVVLNEEAYLEDIFCVPDGFTSEVVSYSGPWTLSGEGPWQFCVEYSITNVNATCDTAYVLNNQAKLSLNDTGEQLLANAKVKVYTSDYETSLGIEKEITNVSWTESSEFDLQVNGTVPDLVDLTGGDPLNGSSPVAIQSILQVDDNVFVIEGTITLTNTGYYATQDLALTYTVQMWNGEAWVDIASADVNVCEHPVLAACESYTYPFSITVCIDGTELGPFGSIHNVTLASVVRANISNLDDDVNPDTLVDMSPLFIPLKQDELTVVTKACYTNLQHFDLPQCGEFAWMEFANQLNYEQTIVVTNCGTESSVCTTTDIQAQTLVTYHNCCMEPSKTLYNNYSHSESAIVTGDGRAVALEDQASSDDPEVMTVCVLSYHVPMNLESVLLYAESFGISVDNGVYMLSNAISLFYGVSASWNMPVIPVIPPVA